MSIAKPKVRDFFALLNSQQSKGRAVMYNEQISVAAVSQVDAALTVEREFRRRVVGGGEVISCEG